MVRQELYSFFLRAQQEFSKLQNYEEALKNACYKENEKRNEIDIDAEFLVEHNAFASRCLEDFNVFLNLFESGILKIKKFTKRELTSEEIL